MSTGGSFLLQPVAQSISRNAPYAIGGPGITGRIEPTADTAIISHATESQTQITPSV